MSGWATPPSTAGTFRKKFRKNSGKTPETLSERFLEFLSGVRLGSPKPYKSRHLKAPEHFQNCLPPSTTGDASFFRSGSREGLSEPVMEFPAVLGVYLTGDTLPDSRSKPLLVQDSKVPRDSCRVGRGGPGRSKRKRLNTLGPAKRFIRLVVQKWFQKFMVMIFEVLEGETCGGCFGCQFSPRKIVLKIGHQKFTTFFTLKFARSKEISHLEPTHSGSNLA